MNMESFSKICSGANFTDELGSAGIHDTFQLLTECLEASAPQHKAVGIFPSYACTNRRKHLTHPQPAMGCVLVLLYAGHIE
jgi:hypothetical protein